MSREDIEALEALLSRKAATAKPVVVCLCGSTRFTQAYQDAQLSETLAGRIVLSVGINTKSDDELASAGVVIDKDALDVQHLYKIDLADEVLILNVDGYVGPSTRREVLYATLRKKRIRWLEEQHAPGGL